MSNLKSFFGGFGGKKKEVDGDEEKTLQQSGPSEISLNEESDLKSDAKSNVNMDQDDKFNNESSKNTKIDEEMKLEINSKNEDNTVEGEDNNSPLPETTANPGDEILNMTAMALDALPALAPDVILDESEHHDQSNGALEKAEPNIQEPATIEYYRNYIESVSQADSTNVTEDRNLNRLLMSEMMLSALDEKDTVPENPVCLIKKE